jgi:hypothetical protein
MPLATIGQQYILGCFANELVFNDEILKILFSELEQHHRFDEECRLALFLAFFGVGLQGLAQAPGAGLGATGPGADEALRAEVLADVDEAVLAAAPF